MSDATDLKQRFATARLRTLKDQEIDKHLAAGKVSQALTLAALTGLPQLGKVVDLQARRARQ